MHEMTHDETGSIAAVSRIVAVYLDTTLRKARALPAHVRERMPELPPDCVIAAGANDKDLSCKGA